MSDRAAPLLELRNVSVVRGDNLALDRVSLSIEQGEHLCILGPNGCGKSTLIKTLTRECYPIAREESSIRILGRDLWNIFDCARCWGLFRRTCWLHAPRTRPGWTWCYPDFQQHPHLSQSQPQAEHRERAEEALTRLGIAHLAKRPLAEMSSGEASAP